MMCCKERQAPRDATRLKVVFTFLLWVPTSVAMFIFGLSVHANNFLLNQDVAWQLCTTLQLADETIGGSNDMLFMGIENSRKNLLGVAKALDFDGSTMHAIRKVIDQTHDFAVKQDQLHLRVEHFSRVLQMQGPSERVFEHRCVFCSLVIGDPNNVFQGFPKEGLLNAIASEIAESSSQAMDGIREYTSARLTGANLTALASRVKRSTGALGVFNSSMRSIFVEPIANRLPTIDTLEAIRVAVFVVVGVSGMSSVAVGWLAFFIQRIRRRQRPDVVPSGKPNCFSWCCGFCYVTASLLIGGTLVVGSLFGAEGCKLIREELTDHAGIQMHAAALGLTPTRSPEDRGYYDDASWVAVTQMAVGLFQTCLSANGTGDLLSEMDLREQLDFQSDLSQAFWRLEERVAEAPSGRLTGEYMSILKSSASQYGGTFVLDPMPASAGRNGSLGVLELNPNVAGLLLGSSVVPEDTRSPDGQAIMRGLNSYAALVAGPGKYTFAHGTAGGGVVIRPDNPSNAELSSLPSNVRNALLYGRAKEQLLESDDSLRCDELDVVTGIVTERRCSVAAFHAYVIAEVARLEQAAQASAAEAVLVQHLFLNEMRQELAPTLRLVRDLGMMSDCRFLWRRIEAFDDATCESFFPTVARVGSMLLALAMAGAMGILIHYKVWRHLKDNKVVGLEHARFEKTYKEFRRKMAAIDDEKASKEHKKHLYKKAIADMHSNALHHHEIKHFEDSGGHHHKMDDVMVAHA